MLPTFKIIVLKRYLSIENYFTGDASVGYESETMFPFPNPEQKRIICF
jgi:hypothetical protein